MLEKLNSGPPPTKKVIIYKHITTSNINAIDHTISVTIIYILHQKEMMVKCNTKYDRDLHWRRLKT